MTLYCRWRVMWGGSRCRCWIHNAEKTTLWDCHG